jgi:hydrogenase expression/formation protein HypC
MCLGIPGEIVAITSEHDLLMAKVDFGGVYRRVCLQHTPDAKVGDYVIVHVGFSLQVIDENEAKQVFAFLQNMNDLQELQPQEIDTWPEEGEKGGSPLAEGV